MVMEIRLANLSDAESIARVHIDTWRAAYVGIVPEDFLAAQSYAQRTQDWAERLANAATVCYVAQDDAGAVVAFARGGPVRSCNQLDQALAEFDAELYALYVLPGHQRHGLGRRLCTEVLRWLRLRSFRAVLLWTLETNGAFYEKKLGAELLPAVRTDEVGGATLNLVSYGWRTL
eukprot:TRINITY_DN4816_c0_g1_i1.p2 TRINITY_DN4816_c0_g1~~TRINITY_DN4816_c0_g1_i1.p2  ORF type:complete len:175 (+),score=26.94 TRINITY_DN4816_c0_g1_i1:186-710(+)